MVDGISIATAEMQRVAWQWVSISWNSVVTTVTNAKCQRVAVAVDPGITVTNA